MNTQHQESTNFTVAGIHNVIFTSWYITLCILVMKQMASRIGHSFRAHTGPLSADIQTHNVLSINSTALSLQ